MDAIVPSSQASHSMNASLPFLADSSTAIAPANRRIYPCGLAVQTTEKNLAARRNASESFHLGYRPALDGLRGLAVLAVIVYHSSLRTILPGGFLGVDVFFVLSGFLVTALLLQDHRQNGVVQLRRFYLRRMLRLLPALFVMLAACCIFAAYRMKPDRAQGVYQAVALTACVAANSDWFWGIRLDLLAHAWSLSLEEQFYLVWPPILALLLRFRIGLRRMVWLVVLAMAAAVLIRAALWKVGAEAATTSLPARAEALLVGCLVALLASANCLPQSPRFRTGLRVLAAISAAILLSLGVAGEAGAAFLYLGGYTVVAGAAAVVIAALVHAPPPLGTRILSAPVLVWIGRISYGLYLWHFPMLSVVPKLIHGILPAVRHFPGLTETTAFALSFGIAALSYYVVERPCLRWKTQLGHV
jgi:peptidoglycan/LPS O-acetylase OafA/YrhL